MDRNRVNDYCAQHADLVRARLEPLYFGGPPGQCDICGQDLSSMHYFGDCEVPGRDQ